MQYSDRNSWKQSNVYMRAEKDVQLWICELFFSDLQDFLFNKLKEDMFHCD
jgi:hypothetical protein